MFRTNPAKWNPATLFIMDTSCKFSLCWCFLNLSVGWWDHANSICHASPPCFSDSPPPNRHVDPAKKGVGRLVSTIYINRTYFWDYVNWGEGPWWFPIYQAWIQSLNIFKSWVDQCLVQPFPPEKEVMVRSLKPSYTLEFPWFVGSSWVTSYQTNTKKMVRWNNHYCSYITLVLGVISSHL